MKNFIIINVIFLTIFVIFPNTSLAKDEILPLPKPIASEEVKKITSDKKNIYPKKKPKTGSDDKTTEAQADDPQLVDTKEEVFIYPKKKPILVQKKVDKVARKSSILSNKKV